ncbi:SDH family Clp fold serine proteinase [Deinococcota bacterium DY0809b]
MMSPYFQQQALFAARARKMAALEKRRKSRVITLIHRQEAISLLGIPLARFIDIDDSEQVLRAIRMTDKHVPIDLILHTPGGLVLAAEQIAEALKRHPAKVTVFVPHYAMSGGTLIALGADEIVMDENAVLGPVDPQLGNKPAASIVKVLEMKEIADIDDETLILADVSKKALKQVKDTVVGLLKNTIPDDRVEDVAALLSQGTWTHDYPIDVAQARGFGLPVSTEMPPEVYELMELYPQPRGGKPSVQYIPLPHQRDVNGKGR